MTTFEQERAAKRAVRKQRAIARQAANRKRADEAAAELGRRGCDVLSVALLHDLTCDSDVKHVRFVLPTDEEVTLPRALLRRATTEARRNKRMKNGLLASVDAQGVLLRWATGQLRLTQQWRVAPPARVVAFSDARAEEAA